MFGDRIGGSANFFLTSIMASLLDLSQRQSFLMDLIYENDLKKIVDLAPTLPTLDFVAPDSDDTPLTLAVGAAEEEIIE